MTELCMRVWLFGFRFVGVWVSGYGSRLVMLQVVQHPLSHTHTPTHVLLQVEQRPLSHTHTPTHNVYCCRSSSAKKWKVISASSRSCRCVCVCVCARARVRVCPACLVVCARVFMRVRLCVSVCVRACVRACVCARVCASLTMVLACLFFVLRGLSEELYGAFMCVCHFELAHMIRLD